MSISRAVTERLPEYSAAPWTPERELTLPPPREVALGWPMRLFGTAILAMVVVVISFGFAPIAKRSYLMWRGESVTGTVLQKFQTETHVKSGVTRHYHLSVQYSPSGTAQMGRIEVSQKYYAMVTSGQTIPIHCDRQKPSEFTLDEDSTHTPWQTLIPLVLLVVLRFVFGSLKRFAENGVAVKGLLVSNPGRGLTRRGILSIYYEFGQEAYNGLYMPRRQRGVAKKAGDTVSLLIDPEKPRNYIVYPMPEIRIVG
jgi:Protein of unknown function (DUF3592)